MRVSSIKINTNKRVLNTYPINLPTEIRQHNLTLNIINRLNDNQFLNSRQAHQCIFTTPQHQNYLKHVVEVKQLNGIRPLIFFDTAKDSKNWSTHFKNFIKWSGHIKVSMIKPRKTPNMLHYNHTDRRRSQLRPHPTPSISLWSSWPSRSIQDHTNRSQRKRVSETALFRV